MFLQLAKTLCFMSDCAATSRFCDVFTLTVLSKSLFGELGHRSDRFVCSGCITKRAVQAAIGLNNASNNLFDIFGFGNIRLHKDRCSAGIFNLLHGFKCRLWPSRSNHCLRAFPGKRKRRGLSNPGAPPFTTATLFAKRFMSFTSIQDIAFRHSLRAKFVFKKMRHLERALAKLEVKKMRHPERSEGPAFSTCRTEKANPSSLRPSCLSRNTSMDHYPCAEIEALVR